jgi:uncharacterized membrane protein YeaQ/YmgE (transglycosylase-associated protein family)
MYSKIQVAVIVTGVVGCILLLWLTKQFHDLDAGYLPYVSLLGAFVSISVAKGALLDYSVEEEA